MKFRIRRLAFTLFTVLAMCCLVLSQANFSHAAGIDYEALANLSGGRFSADGLRSFVADLKNDYIPTSLSNITETFSTLTPTVSGLKMGLDFVNNPSPNSALALTSSNGVNYKLTINLAKLGATADKKVKIDDLFFTIVNHELMHAVMFDVTTNGMLGKRDWNVTPVKEIIDEFPRWFNEGIAQAVGGGAEHSAELVHDLYYRLPLSRREADTKAWLGKFYWLGYEAYAQGYIATLYFGFLAGDGQSLTAENIARGLNLILQDLSDGYSLSETINRRTNGKYADLEDFKNKFADDAYQFSIDYVEAIDTDDPGAGSVVSTGGLKAKARVLHSGRQTKSNFFVLDTTKLGEANNSAILSNMLIATGGGNTKTERIMRNGKLNEQASEVWPAPIGTAYQYKVMHYTENDNGSYSLHSTDNLTAVYGTTVQATIKNLAGFVLNNHHGDTALSKVIRGSGQVLRVYYKKQATPSAPSAPTTSTQPQPTKASDSASPTGINNSKARQTTPLANETQTTDAANQNSTDQTNNDSNSKQTTPDMRTTEPLPETKTSNESQETQASVVGSVNWLMIAALVTTAAGLVLFAIIRLKK